MTLAGSAVKGASGCRYQLGPQVNEGGQGIIHHATETGSGRKGVVKMFRPEWCRSDIRERTKYLVSVGERLHRACPVLCTPLDLIERPRGWLGHFSLVAAGEPWETFMATANFTFLEGLQACIAVARAVEELDANGIAHGDLQSGNLLIEHDGTKLRVSLIDFDNFVSREAPPPPHLGQILYLAPELREAPAGSRAGVPSVGSDRFALTVLFHEMLLLLHPATGADSTEKLFREAMCRGMWRQDPAAPRADAHAAGGYPTEVLNSELMRLFRAGMSRNPAERPDAARWKEAFLRAMSLVHACHACGGPDLVEEGKTACPVCRAPYPALSVESRRGGRIRLETGSTVVGRNQLGGASTVSERHAVFMRRGPETWLLPSGRNGTRRWNGSGWVRLPDGVKVLVQAGDRLKLADVEVEVTE